MVLSVCLFERHNLSVSADLSVFSFDEQKYKQERIFCVGFGTYSTFLLCYTSGCFITSIRLKVEVPRS